MFSGSSGRLMRTATYAAPILATLLASVTARAESADPVIPALGDRNAVAVSFEETASELFRRGEYLKAVRLGESRVAEDIGIDNEVAVAKSAWALGVPELSLRWWERVLKHRELAPEDRARALLGKGIIYLQERQYEDARAAGERGAQLIDRSPLRAQLWLLVGEALALSHMQSLAATYYERASTEGDEASRSEAMYRLGQVQEELGMLQEARYSFNAIEPRTKYAPLALRKLAEIDFQQRDYNGVLFWLREGREEYAEQFEDGWSRYVTTAALAELGKVDDANRYREQSRARLGSADPWSTLIGAVVEGAQARTAVHGDKEGERGTER